MTLSVEVNAAPLVSQVGDSLPYEEGMISVLTGPKGSTKTCNLARIAMWQMAVCDKRVYSNIPVGGMVMGKYYEVEPLPDNVFVTYGRNVEPRSFLIVTELGEYFNNQDWQQLQSKMGVSMFAQIRKLNLYITGDTQYFHHLNPRLAEQVDCLIRCRDLSKEDWGKENKVEKGSEGRLDYYDLSGDLSPDGRCARSEFQPNMIIGKPYKTEVVYTKAFWEYFDSHKLVALDQRFKKFYIEKEKILVPKAGMEAVNSTAEKQNLIRFIKMVFNEAAETGIEEMKATDISGRLYADGFEIDPGHLGREIRKLGIEGKWFSSRATGPGVYYRVKHFDVVSEGAE